MKGVFYFATVCVFASLLLGAWIPGTTAQNGQIKFGISTALNNTPVAPLAKALLKALNYTFIDYQLNQAQKGGVLVNNNITLSVLDDEYNPALTAINMNILANDPSIMGIISCSGTAAAAVVTSFLYPRAPFPFIAPYSGASWLRTPFNTSTTRNVINIRASIADEVAALVNYLTGTLLFNRISLLYQDDAFGLAANDSLNRLLKQIGLRVASYGVVPASDPTLVLPAIGTIAAGRPQAVIMWVIPTSAVLFISATAAQESFNSTIYAVNSVATFQLLESLPTFGGDKAYDRIVATSLFPLASDNSSQLIQEMNGMLARTNFNASDVHTFATPEGYLVARFIISVLERMSGSITRAAFLDAVYGSPVTVIGGIQLGPFGDDCNVTGVFGCCNQGMRSVFLTTAQRLPGGRGYWTPVAGNDVFRWEGCQSIPSQVGAPITFGQSALLAAAAGVTVSSPDALLVGPELRNGILAAFRRKNQDGGFNGRKLYLVTFDDGDSPEQAAVNTQDLLEQNQVYGLVGYMNADAAWDTLQTVRALSEDSSQPQLKPLIGTALGSSFLREPFNKLSLNVRPSYADEIAALVARVDTTYGATEFALFEGNFPTWSADNAANDYGGDGDAAEHAAGKSLRETVNLALRARGFSGISKYGKSYASVVSDGTPDAIIVAGDASSITAFLDDAFNDGLSADVIIAAVLPWSPDSLYTALSDPANPQRQNYAKRWTIVVSSVVPDPTNSSIPLVAEYQEAMQAYFTELARPFVPSYLSLEGYAIGQFIVRAIETINGDITSERFVDAVYTQTVFTVGGQRLGPFVEKCGGSGSTSTQCCNQGLGDVYIGALYTDDASQSIAATSIGSENYFTTCGALFDVAKESESSSLDIVPIVVPTVVVGTLVLAGLGVLIFILAYLRKRGPKEVRLVEPNYREVALKPFKEHEEQMEASGVGLFTPLMTVGGRRSAKRSMNEVLNEFNELVLNPDYAEVLVRVLRVEGIEMKEIAHCFTCLYYANSADSLNALLAKSIEAELAAVPPAVAVSADSPLFRQDSFLSHMYKLFSRLVALPYLWHTMAEIVAEIERIAEQAVAQASRRAARSGTPTANATVVGSSLELDPMKMNEADDQKLNMLQLKLIAQKLFVAITKSADTFPPELRDFLGTLRQKLERAAAGTSDASTATGNAAATLVNVLYSLIGSFVFLRLFCVALSVPNQYGLSRDQPIEDARRFLVLLSKVLQNLSNGTLFSKEAYMIPMNDFILENKQELRQLFDKLSLSKLQAAEGEINIPMPSEQKIPIPGWMKEACLKRLFSYVTSHKSSIIAAIHTNEAEAKQYKDLEEFLEEIF